MSIPRVSEAFAGWTTNIAMKIVQRSITDFEATETEVRESAFRAVIQPMPAQKLLIKPEGQRNWKWWTMWTTKNLDNDTIISDGRNNVYRVMSRSDWGRAGFGEYELTEAAPND